MKIERLSENQFVIESLESKILAGQKCQVNSLELQGPGEYEIANVITVGLAANSYLFQTEGINLVFLGQDSHLGSDDLEKIDGVDVLILGVSDPKGATEIIEEVDPKVVIPYAAADLGQFLKAVGVKGETLPSYKLTKKSLPTEEERKIIILNERAKS